jgi:GST-like protein
MTTKQVWTVYGVPGWGSTLAEAMLACCGVTPAIEGVSGFDSPGEARERLLRVNPLAQVPTIVTPEGDAVSESGAITLLLAERFPQRGLAPTAGSRERTAFLRLLFRLTSAVYPTFTYADYPERWVSADGAILRERVAEYRRSLWKAIDRDVVGPWALGESFSAVDIFITVMTRWSPGRAWFGAECPRLHAIAVRAEQCPSLGAVMSRNFPSA